MALKAVLETLEDLPEELRPVAQLLYREDGGRYRLDAPELADAGRRALEHERRQRADAVRAREEVERQLADLQAKLDGSSAPAADSKESEQMKRAYDERLKSIEAKLAAADKARQDAEEKLAQSAISDTLRGALVELGVPKESIEDLIQLPRFRGPWRHTEEGPAPYDGDVARFDPDNPSRPMSAKAYAREYLKENKHWLPPATGGGAPGGAARMNGSLGQFALTADQAKDVNVYRAAKEAAAKAGQEVRIIE